MHSLFLFMTFTVESLKSKEDDSSGKRMRAVAGKREKTTFPRKEFVKAGTCSFLLSLCFMWERFCDSFVFF